MSKMKVVDESDSDVPLSERGKGESMSMEDRTPGFAIGLVGLSYLVVLLLCLAGIAVWVLI
ncbi:hypothetical protein [Planctomycetes bacterium TBK1r]|uniref:Uncharacterized protein n=1 Tax=Stieleria magnilauensis TaxID=2527963 RepID=A0ABX5XWN0_9BACT|nr:hypothetical protein TBK1r_48660 [Planctomycetes bacterium TBK1r]